MPTLLKDTNLFLWVDLEAPTKEELKTLLEGVFHFHPLSIEDCISDLGAPKVEEYAPKELLRLAMPRRIPALHCPIDQSNFSKRAAGAEE